jgi:WD40 repeat protein
MVRRAALNWLFPCPIYKPQDGTARNWNAVTGECAAVMRCSGPYFLTCSWQLNGSMIAAAGKDHSLSLWKPESAASAPPLCLKWTPRKKTRVFDGRSQVKLGFVELSEHSV